MPFYGSDSDDAKRREQLTALIKRNMGISHKPPSDATANWAAEACRVIGSTNSQTRSETKEWARRYLALHRRIAAYMLEAGDDVPTVKSNAGPSADGGKGER